MIINFTIDVAKSSMFINLFPTFLHPYVFLPSFISLDTLRPYKLTVRNSYSIVGPILSQTNKTQRKMLRLAGPLIEERKAKLAADKNYADKPVCNLADYNVCTPIGCADIYAGLPIRTTT